jgi:exopolyphosphatase/guanosine-5'-triphosphate,3'-diphosphate pyrophosphatase
MKVHLVRCASGVDLASWQGAGGARPLSEQGKSEAAGLVGFLAGRRIERLLAGPQQRCRETLAPLAAERGLPVHVDDRLDEDAPLEPALRLLRRLEEPAVVCTHRVHVTGLLSRLLGVPAGPDLDARCEPGSTWLLEGEPPHATYFSPRRELAHTLPRVTRLRLQRLTRARRRGTTPERIAVFELGSTALHLLVAEATPTGELQRVVRERIPWREGGGLAGQEVAPEAVELVVDAARRLRERAERLRPVELVAVGTAALREAKNSRELADAVGTAVGAPVQVLSPREEARLVFQAIRGRVELGTAGALGLDLGGGNLSLVVGGSEGVRLVRTLPLGVARLHAELVRHDPADAEELRALRLRIRERLEPELEAIAALGATRTIGVGGTVRAVARFLASRDHDERVAARGVFVARPDLAALGRELSTLERPAREALAGVTARRAELLPLGVEILVAALSLLRSDGFTLCDWGLREGIVLDTRRARPQPGRRRPSGAATPAPS